MKKILFILISILALKLLAAQKNDFQSLDKLTLESLLKGVSTKVSDKLPLMVAGTNFLKITNIEPQGKILMTRKELDMTNKNFFDAWNKRKESFIKLMYNLELKRVCKQEFSLYLLNRDAIYQYFYYDNNKKLLFNYFIDKNICEKVNKKIK